MIFRNPSFCLAKINRIILILLFAHAGQCMGESIKPIWLTQACFEIPLNAWDKLGIESKFNVKYIVTTRDGMVYTAERSGVSSNIESAKVTFPNDFMDSKTNIPADSSCDNGMAYDWSIVVDGKVVDSGFFDFGRGHRP